MDKSITLYFGRVDKIGDYKTRLDKIKQAGYNKFMTSVGLVRQNGFLRSQVKYARKIGLEVSSLHSDYKAQDLHYFWEEGKKGERICRSLMHQLRLAHKYGFSCLVIHTLGEKSEIGINRYRKILKLSNRLGTPIAIENISNPIVLDYLFDTLGQDKMLKVCYDSGHENIFPAQFNFLEKYLDRVVCLHLHDNYGVESPDNNKDRHSFIGDGNIDWDRIAKLLSKTDLSLDLELLMHYENNYTYDELLEKAMAGANMLEEKILKYKNNTKK